MTDINQFFAGTWLSPYNLLYCGTLSSKHIRPLETASENHIAVANLSTPSSVPSARQGVISPFYSSSGEDQVCFARVFSNNSWARRAAFGERSSRPRYNTETALQTNRHPMSFISFMIYWQRHSTDREYLIMFEFSSFIKIQFPVKGQRRRMADS